MTVDILRNILRFAFVLMLQGLIVNKLDLFDGLILPQIYLFAILMLPLETPRLGVLIIAGVTGMIADMFTSTPGLHTSACLVLGYLQPLVQRLIAPRDGYEFGQQATVQSLGLTWFLTYALSLVLVHHFLLFFLEAFRFEDFFRTLGRVLLSTLGTMVQLIIGQYLIYSPRGNR